MKKNLFIGLLLFIACGQSPHNPEKEKEAIMEVIQTAYVEGLQNEGNIDKIDSGFHPDFRIMAIGKNNTMWSSSIQKWKEVTEEKKKEGKLPITDEKKLNSVKFAFIDVSGNAAVAKLEYYIGKKLSYIDYISLYKFDEGWKIVNKIFNAL